MGLGGVHLDAGAEEDVPVEAGRVLEDDAAAGASVLGAFVASVLPDVPGQALLPLVQLAAQPADEPLLGQWVCGWLCEHKAKRKMAPRPDRQSHRPRVPYWPS